MYKLGPRLTRETDKGAFKEALLSLLCLRPDCSVTVPGGFDRAKKILDQAKVPKSKIGRGAASGASECSMPAEGEDNIILKAYR